MILTVLGSGTLIPHPDRGTPGFAVHGNAESDLLLFDGGSGTLQRAARVGLEWAAARSLFYTHFHLDHTLDLASFLFAANWIPPRPRTAPLAIYGPTGLDEYYRKLLDLWPYIAPRHYELTIHELEPGDRTPDTDVWNIACSAARHGSASALSYRIERGGRSLVLSGDTEYCPELAVLAHGADLLVCECSTDEAGKKEGHMTPSEVARVIAEAGVSRVLINHVYPPLKPSQLAAECEKLSGARVEAAVDLRSYEV